MIGQIGGPSYDWEYDLCVEARYDDLVESEENESPCMGDFDGDGERQLNDLLMICGELGQGGPACVCDTDGDMVVDIIDFANFLQVYGLDCEGNEMPPPTLRQVEEMGFEASYIDMNGREVAPQAQGIYLMRIVTPQGLTLYTKVLR
jgi:hypothetical protein